MAEEITLNKVFSFDAAHKLPFHKGKCSQLHGHTWKLVVSVKGSVNKEGMVVDFLDIKKQVEERVISKLDHSYLNDIVENPTCENLLLWIKNALMGLEGLKKLALYETERSFAELEC